MKNMKFKKYLALALVVLMAFAFGPTVAFTGEGPGGSNGYGYGHDKDGDGVDDHDGNYNGHGYGHIKHSGDETAPTVTIDPADGDVDVPIDVMITVTFSEPVRQLNDDELLDAHLASRLQLKLTDSEGADVPFTASINPEKTVIEIVPDADLLYSQYYYVRVKARFEGYDDNKVNSTSAIFMTEEEEDITAPTAIYDPEHGTLNVPVDKVIMITFDEMVTDLFGDELLDIDVSELEDMLTLRRRNASGVDVDFSAVVTSLAGEIPVIEITPDEDLIMHSRYYVSISESVKDEADNVIEPSYAMFAVGEEEDVTAPIAIYDPHHAELNVAPDKIIMITFDEMVTDLFGNELIDIDVSELEDMLTLRRTNSSGDDVDFAAVVTSLAGEIPEIAITPDEDLMMRNRYYVSISESVKDMADNVIEPSYAIFAVDDITAPMLIFDPENLEVDVPIDKMITITFDEMVRNLDDSELVDGDLSAILELREDDVSGDHVPFTATVNPEKTMITIDPVSDLMYDQVYYVAIAASVEDKYDNPIVAESVMFTTVEDEEPVDETPPYHTFDPYDGETGVPINTMITITFNEPVRKTDGSVLVDGDLYGMIELKRDNDSGSHVLFTASINTEKTVITIDPTSNLSYSQYYYVEIEAVEDEAGNENTQQSIIFRTTSRPSSGGGGGSIDAGPSYFIIEDELTPLGAVEFLNAYVKGYPDKTFRPKRSVTRAELSAIFARVLGLDLSNPGPQKFTDVNREDWHYNYIQALAGAGLLTGYDDGTFKPNRAISHAEAASMIAEYWELLEIEVSDESSGMKDIKGHWAESDINKVVNAGVTEGFGANSFFPTHMTSRGQMVQMVNKLLARPMIERDEPSYLDVDFNHGQSKDIESASYKVIKGSK